MQKNEKKYIREISNARFIVYKYFLYVDFCKNVPIYVGIGNKQRLKVKYRNTKHQRYYKKYGVTRVVVLQSNDYAYLQIQEILGIRHYKTFCEYNKVGCNLTKGGEGLSNVCRETRDKISKAHMGKVLSNITKEKLRRHFTNVRHSSETINKMAKDRGSKPFNVYKNGQYIGTWLSKSKCSKDLNISRNSINRYFNKLQYQVKGYTFES